MTQSGLQPIHPGEYVAEMLQEIGIAQTQFARTIGVSPKQIERIIDRSQPVTSELAILLGRAFGQTPEYWLNLQATFYQRSGLPVTGNDYPADWDAERVQQLITHYESQSEEEALCEDENHRADRARWGSREEFLAAMAKVADVEPDDERDRL